MLMLLGRGGFTGREKSARKLSETFRGSITSRISQNTCTQHALYHSGLHCQPGRHHTISETIKAHRQCAKEKTSKDAKISRITATSA